MPNPPQVEFLEEQLKRPLYNIDDYGFVYESPTFPPRDRDDNEGLMQNEYRKCYRLNDASEVVALNLHSCDLEEYTILKDLGSLQSLDLSSNKISDASFLKDLGSLQSLYLSSNKISNASFLKNLGSLQSLDLSDNQISDYTFLKDLGSLQSLYLSRNQISDASFLKDLEKLRTADLRGNQIRQLPEFLLDTGIEIEEGGKESWERKIGSFNWQGNPIESPPVEVLRRGHQAIVDFFAAGQMEALREAKVLVVGEAEVGKTSLIKQLLNLPFDPKERKTHDIARHQLPLECGEKGKIDLRVWDFGGQDIMHATHQFFLTRRSVYLLVLNSRQNESQSRIDYWLRLIASFGGDSPVIVICNKCDEEKMDLPWNALQKKYPQIKHYVKEVSCSASKGIAEVKERIAQVVAEDLPHVGEDVPVTWFDVKRQLEADAADGQDYLQREDFDTLCGEKGVKPGAEKTVLQFLHDLGVVLHYDQEHPLMQKDSDEMETKVLNPSWVSAAIYAVLNDGELIRNHGVMARRDLERILDEVNDYGYDKQQTDFILGMMDEFDLCFQMPEGKKWLIPDLLQKDQPYVGEWEGGLRFRYEYEVLPASVISRFIVRMENFIKDKTYWRYGVVLERNGVRALVRADVNDAFVDITLLETKAGPKERREFLAAIRAQFETIHGSFSEKFEVTEFAESTEHVDVFQDYQELLDMERAGKETTWVKELKQERLIAEFLDGVSLEREEILEGGMERLESAVRKRPKPTPEPEGETPKLEWEWAQKLAQLPWPIWCGIYGVALAIVVVLIVYLPDGANWFKLLLGVGTAAAGFFLVRNPKRFWMRMFSGIVAAGIAANVLGFGLSLTIKGEDGEALFSWDGGVAWATTVLFSVFAICCVVAQINQDRKMDS